MKTILTLFFIYMAANSYSLFGQQENKKEYCYPHLQNKYDQTSHWKPSKITKYSDIGWMCDIYYEYNKQGDVIKDIVQSGDSIIAFYDKKQAWRKRYNMRDIVDSVLYYKKTGNEFELYKRVRDKNYDYDSLFWLTTTEIWDGTKWIETGTLYEAYYDTSWFAIHYEVSSNGNIAQGYKNSIETDENGNIISVITEDYNASAKRYELSLKMKYLYDENNVCYRSFNYNYISNSWKLIAVSDYEWEEWNGFDDGTILWIGVAYDLPTNNRLRQLKYWNYNDDEWTLLYQTIWDWNIDENGSFSRDIYDNMSGEEEQLYHSLSDTLYFDEQGYMKEKVQHEYSLPDENGNQKEIFFWQELVESEYGDKGRERWHSFFTSDDSVIGDSINWERLFIVDSFVDITTLSIDESALQEKNKSIVVIPNPAAGDITIRAEEALQRVEIFDMSGKAVFGREAIGKKEIRCSLGMLPKGVYLVRAQLKNGKIATEKVVLQ